MYMYTHVHIKFTYYLQEHSVRVDIKLCFAVNNDKKTFVVFTKKQQFSKVLYNKIILEKVFFKKTVGTIR